VGERASGALGHPGRGCAAAELSQLPSCCPPLTKIGGEES